MTETNTGTVRDHETIGTMASDMPMATIKGLLTVTQKSCRHGKVEALNFPVNCAPWQVRKKDWQQRQC